MRLLGFNLTKISAEKFSSNLANLKIETKIDIKNILETKQDFIKVKEDMVAVNFSYDIDYKENIAKIILEGSLLLSLDSKTFKEVIKQWKDKKMPPEFNIALFNIIMKKSSLKALDIEELFGLPFHIQFPTIRKKE